ncbi:MAG: DNA polymerase III subunit epsilon [Burkholderiaceae bacterium]|nr:MAG: DNA polymerase III subunit epsilon [Burkholderiaceae bacterium]
MRQIVLDTETTGLDPKLGNRIIEIGCVELVNRRLSGRNLHFYINPERDSEEGALRVHGLSTEFLSDKPKFGDVAEAIRDYVRDAEIIIHNAPFDLAFLDAEFARLGWPKFAEHVGPIVDSLVMAKTAHPGKRNSLDALCERYEVSNSHRTLHGALLDSELLAEVYLAMTRGQDSLVMDLEDSNGGNVHAQIQIDVQQLIVLPAAAEEIAAHDAVLDQIEKESKAVPLWRQSA